MWYKAKAQRIENKERHQRKSKSSNKDSNDEGDDLSSKELDVDDWEAWMQSNVEEIESDDEELLNLDDWNIDQDEDCD